MARIADWLLPAAFVGGILLILGLTEWRVPPGTVDVLEDRPAATMPAFDPAHVGKFFPKFYAFFDDHFGLRHWAIALRSRIWLALLEHDPSPDPAFSSTVFPGRDRWLFYTGDGEAADTLHTIPLSDRAVDAWQKGLAERRQWLAERGIPYVFVLAPDKRTIYPALMPSFFTQPRPGVTRREQLDARLAADPGWLDLTETLRAATGEGQLYFRWDTHWKRHAAWIGYTAVMARLGLPSLPEGLGRPEVPTHHPGDLGRMIGLSLIDHDTAPVPTCPRPASAAEADAVAGLAGADPLYREPPTICPGAPGRVLLLHDSFGSMWAPYLSTQFGFAAFAWTRPDFAEFKRMVLSVHPTVVIEERVQRALIAPLSPEAGPRKRVP